MIDTIFAEATAKGRAAIAVIRISGPRAFAAVEVLTGGRPGDRVASLRWLVDPADGERLDQALVLCFCGPNSFTGEDVVELHVHGGVAVSKSVLGALVRFDGLRHAEPGEFTRRALMNGRLDLAQIEGLGDLLAAETAGQRRQAVRLMGGGLSRRADTWRESLVQALAQVEASIDFTDEDLPADLLATAASTVRGVQEELRGELRGGRMAERLRDGFEVALVGPPNVGKSTLLNALAGRDAAITSATAGTTRDVIEVRMDLGGLPVTLLDTAGLRVAQDDLERAGVARALHRARAADLRVFLVSEPEDADHLDLVREPGDPLILAKSDLRPPDRAASVSGLTGAGVAELLDGIAEELGRRAATASTASHARQMAAIETAANALDDALVQLRAPCPRAEIAAADLHRGTRALDFLIGRVDVEAVLDVIFRSFCLGK